VIHPGRAFTGALAPAESSLSTRSIFGSFPLGLVVPQTWPPGRIGRRTFRWCVRVQSLRVPALSVFPPASNPTSQPYHPADVPASKRFLYPSPHIIVAFPFLQSVVTGTTEDHRPCFATAFLHFPRDPPPEFPSLRLGSSSAPWRSSRRGSPSFLSLFMGLSLPPPFCHIPPRAYSFARVLPNRGKSSRGKMFVF